MEYINKDQIISASLSCHKNEWELRLIVKGVKETMNSILTRQKTLKNVTEYIPYEYRIFKETKEDCMALAEKLGLTLID